MNKINCIILDDEPSGRKILEEYIADVPSLRLIGSLEHPLKAMEMLESFPVDLLFLDIQMPKLNGIEFLKTLKHPPMVVFTTAYSEFAVQGFEMDAIDYLLKPISFDRFLRATAKAKQYHELRVKTDQNPYFFVKCNNRFEKVGFDELLYVEAANNYVLLQTMSKRLITYLTFKGMEEQLPADQFVKVHKSFLVSLDKIDHLDGETITVGSHRIPISRSMKDAVLQHVVHDRLIRR